MRDRKLRNIRLNDHDWSDLAKIADREGFIWGNEPNRSEAIRALIERYFDDRGETRDCHSLDEPIE